MASRRSGRASGASALPDTPSSPSDSLLTGTSKSASSRPRPTVRGGGRRSDRFEGGEIVTGTRNRGGRKNYVIDSSPDDDDDDDEEEDDDANEDTGHGDGGGQGDNDDDDDDDVDMDDSDDDDDMGEEAADEDADGEDMEVDPPVRGQNAAGAGSKEKQRAGEVDEDEDEDDEEEDGEDEEEEDEEEEEEEVNAEDDDDDDELSDPGESDGGEQSLAFADETMVDAEGDEDAEGEEIEVARDGAKEAAKKAELASDEEDGGSREGSPDLTKMTKRQRARFEDGPQDYMKLSDEVQVKKHFTAEELSMRRQEMARRRRNLSEKRNEEVKMETINKLLKKQAPKMNRKGAAAAAAAAAGRATTPDEDDTRAKPVLLRWVSSKGGSRVAVPRSILVGPGGDVFRDP